MLGAVALERSENGATLGRNAQPAGAQQLAGLV
jgi:hypothetical protein